MGKDRDYIPARLRRKVEVDAGFRCGYCLTEQRIIGQTLHVEHIIPRKAGGATDRENLWLACPLCNDFKLAQTHARDPLTGRLVRLFNPRKQRWKEHFAWSEDGTEIIGLTACGRATVLAFQLNCPIAVRARAQWVQAGWWPPED